jgi:hypothetical protein
MEKSTTIQFLFYKVSLSVLHIQQSFGQKVEITKCGDSIIQSAETA